MHFFKNMVFTATASALVALYEKAFFIDLKYILIFEAANSLV